MPIGRPDWYITGLSENISTVNDTGELAVRLGSPVNFDRTGKVLYSNTFPTKQNVSISLIGTPVEGPTIDPTRFLYGCSSLYCKIDDISTNTFQVSYTSRLWLASLLSFECGFFLPDIISRLDFIFNANVNGRNYLYEIRYDFDTSLLYYYTVGGTRVPFADATHPFFSASGWNVFKLDIDLSDFTYKRFRYNSYLFDLEGFTPNSAVSAISDIMVGSIKFYGNDSADARIYLDYMIMTEDE